MSVQAVPVSQKNEILTQRGGWRSGLVRFGRRIADLLTDRAPMSACLRPGLNGRSPAHRKTMRFVVPCEPVMVSFIRDRAADFVSGMPFTSEEVHDIRLSVGEAAANALSHGANRKWSKIGAEFRRKGNTLHVAIWDKGQGFDPGSVCQTPECLAEGGRGVFFMKALMDDVTFRFTKPGTRVEMTKTARNRKRPD